MSITRRTVIFFTLACLVGILIGILFQKFYGIGRIINAFINDRNIRNVNHNPAVSVTANHIEVPFDVLNSKRRVMVALVFGQSNSANFGETPKASNPNVYNYYKGKLYRAQDPLLGADGDGGSVWTRLGDKLIAHQKYEAVIFIPLGIGATEIARWQSKGDLHQSILNVIDALNRQGLSITHMLWHQGESDAVLKTSKVAYKSMFLDMLSSIREHDVKAPIYVSIATRCEKLRGSIEIQEAQAELVDISAGILPGPNTDNLGFSYRYDGCHFSDEGLEQEAEMWLSSLEKIRPVVLREQLIYSTL